MIYEITTTTNGLTIVNGLDSHQINIVNIVDVALMGNKIAIVSNLRMDAYHIDFDKGVTLNGVAQTSITSLHVALKAVATLGSYPLSFTNTDLVANVLTVDHNLGAVTASTHIFNNLGAEVTGQYTPTKVTINQLTIDFGGAITGTWFLVVTRLT
jgi:hypothetical protein